MPLQYSDHICICRNEVVDDLVDLLVLFCDQVEARNQVSVVLLEVKACFVVHALDMRVAHLSDIVESRDDLRVVVTRVLQEGLGVSSEIFDVCIELLHRTLQPIGGRGVE